jgi:signal peptidase I
MRYRCPDCGYTFDLNYSAPNPNSDDMAFPSEAMVPADVYCPNCGYQVANGPTRGPAGAVYPYGSHPDTVHYGDRILVLKYAYLLNQPNRWDVVVFKSPADPDKYHYTQNFIKRLVGEPGDQLMVLDGDIYLKDSLGSWQIQRKPPNVEQALWRVVYDNDFYPQGLTDRNNHWNQPWKQTIGDGWNLGHDYTDGRVFHFAGQNPAVISFDPSANDGTQTTNDYLVYDIPQNQRRPGAQANQDDRNIVSDLKLALWYQRATGAGPLKLRLTKRDHAFVAQIDGDSVTLFHTRPDGTTSTDAGPVKLADLGVKASEGMFVEFANYDYKVTLRLNGKEVLSTTPDEYSPEVNQLLREYHQRNPRFGRTLPAIDVTAADQTCTLAHVGLWRDIFYTNKGGQLLWGTPDRPVQLHRHGEPREDTPGAFYDDDEYFVMGDNSLISGDARYWGDRISLPDEDLDVDSGRVPGRFMLGRAFFVYWPAGFKPVSTFPSIVPNFGDMRFIH